MVPHCGTYMTMIQIIYHKSHPLFEYTVTYYLHSSLSHHMTDHHENYYYFIKIIIIFVMISRMVGRILTKIKFNNISYKYIKFLINNLNHRYMTLYYTAEPHFRDAWDRGSGRGFDIGDPKLRRRPADPIERGRLTCNLRVRTLRIYCWLRRYGPSQGPYPN